MDGGASYPATATSSIRNGRPASSHRAAFSGPVFRGCALRFAPCARHSSPSGLRCAQSALAALPASLESSYRPALRWPGIPGLRSASRCPRPSTPSGLRRLRPVSRTARASCASSIQHGRPAALTSSLAALPASLGLLRPVSRTARGLRAPQKFFYPS